MAVAAQPEFFCTPSGYATSGWGLAAWGGVLEALPGGPIPAIQPFDIYCAGPCGPISQLLTYDEVDYTAHSSQVPVDGYTLDQMIISGGVITTAEAEVIVNKAVPSSFTLEFTVYFENLPNDFNDLTNSHIYVGASNAAGSCAALFFSKVGLLYTGCAHYDGAQLVLDTLIQPLANSQLLVSEGEYWTIRLAVSHDTGTTYVYVTKTSELLASGHKLRYVLPAIPSSSAVVVPPDRTLILVRGTALTPSWVSLDNLCMATGLIIPNIAPVADPGIDQAIQLCEILRLDGSKSFDPEGSQLLYKWRLIDAPPGSQYVFVGADGTTHPGAPPTGFTDRFYSVELSTLDAADAIMPGDVVVIQGTAHTIQNTGTDGFGFFVRVDGGFILEDDLIGELFTYLRQNGLNTSTDAKPTFYPDAPGIYKFDLIVFDGGLFSTAESVVVNVTESPVARGCTPDLGFIWGYLSDFWKQLEDPERISVFWQGLAQVAAAELLSLWQVDYSKSLRDVQRTFQRRWLHYDLLMTQSPALLELTTVRAVFGGLESLDLPGLFAGVNGRHLDLKLATRDQPIVINFGQADPYTAVDLQAIIQVAIAQFAPEVRVTLLPRLVGALSRIRIDAPYEVEVLPSTTLGMPVGFSGVNAAPAGTQGAAVGVRTYRVERSLQGLDIQQNDFLCIDGVAYRIDRLVTDPSDLFAFQRIVLLDDLPLVLGTTWSIAGTATSRDLDFYAGLCEHGDEVTFEVLRISDQQLLDVPSQVFGTSSALPKSLPCDATPVGQYLAQPDLFSVFLKSVKRRRFVPIDPLIVDVPYLQEKVVSKDDTQVLRRNVDYFVDTFRGQSCLRFITPVPAGAGGADVWDGDAPPDRMWAEVSYLDNRPRIEQNFGIPAEFTLDDLSQLPDNVDYLSSVRGLWYAYFNGPTVFNLRAGVQILLGLPFAEENGIIVEIRSDFSDSTGRILIQDLADSTITRSYVYPRTLQLEVNPATGALYKVGDAVKQFAPLVTGVEVIDHVKDPKWFQGLLNQGAMFEVEKFHKFLVGIDSDAFNLGALLFVQSFVRRIKPTYTFPLFIVQADVAETEVSVTDDVVGHGTLLLNEGVGFAPHMQGVATLFDDPRASFGGWRSKYDEADDPLVFASYGTPEYPISWAFDREYLAPEDAILAQTAQAFALAFMPQVDMPFLKVDLPAFDEQAVAFASGQQGYIPAAGLQIGLPAPAPATTTWNTIWIEAKVVDPGAFPACNVQLRINGGLAAQYPVTVVEGTVYVQAVSLPIVAGDIIDLRLVPLSATNTPILISKVIAIVGHTSPWLIDTVLPAGTYRAYRLF